MRVAIIGGGAGGFFSALSVKEHHPDAQVIIFEKSQKLLAKVKVSGGGRCNVTNGTDSIKTLAEAYPRGSKQLRKLFGTFNNQHAMRWFEERGVPLVIQDDLCVFPVSQNSQSIIDCFLREANRLGIEIHTKAAVKQMQPTEDGINLTFADEDKASEIFHKVIVATGGSPKESGLEWLKVLGHKIASPVPSLFTFNMPNESITELMGIVVEEAIVRIRLRSDQGTKLRGDGPLLITHWGMSGPAVLKLSAFGARILHEMKYQCVVQVNWVNDVNVDRVTNRLKQLQKDHPNKQLQNARLLEIPIRLWLYLLEKCGISKETTWTQMGKKPFNKLLNMLTNDEYQVSGKTTFKEEFVTCGGVSLESINMKTMESKAVPNLYFTGEVIDVDGITGGYNFQAAWTTAFIAGKLL
ncbi:MAG: NAD(P)/FAD-dependent oxidoreductase [Flavobacteriales bacterium]|nr:NAD(P)/FAD-dependent oxidoreductase [Flavobacteriales bacterium]